MEDLRHRDINSEFFHLSGALVKYFHEEIALFRQKYLNPKKMSNKFFKPKKKTDFLAQSDLLWLAFLFT